MNKKLRIVTFLLCSMLMLTLILTASACGIYHDFPLRDLVIENQTNQVLTIILDDVLVGEVRPGDKITANDFPIGFSEYVIEAKDAQGEIVFSRSYVFEDFQKVDDGVYKVVIPPLQKGSESSDNATGK